MEMSERAGLLSDSLRKVLDEIRTLSQAEIELNKLRNQIESQQKRIEIMEQNDIDGGSKNGLSDQERKLQMLDEIQSLKNKHSETQAVIDKISKELKEL